MEKIDMSLDEIVNINKKEKQTNNASKDTQGRGRGRSTRGGGTGARVGGHGGWDGRRNRRSGGSGNGGTRGVMGAVGMRQGIRGGRVGGANRGGRTNNRGGNSGASPLNRQNNFRNTSGQKHAMMQQALKKAKVTLLKRNQRRPNNQNNNQRQNIIMKNRGFQQQVQEKPRPRFFQNQNRLNNLALKTQQRQQPGTIFQRINRRQQLQRTGPGVMRSNVIGQQRRRQFGQTGRNMNTDSDAIFTVSIKNRRNQANIQKKQQTAPIVLLTRKYREKLQQNSQQQQPQRPKFQRNEIQAPAPQVILQEPDDGLTNAQRKSLSNREKIQLVPLYDGMGDVRPVLATNEREPMPNLLQQQGFVPQRTLYVNPAPVFYQQPQQQRRHPQQRQNFQFVQQPRQQRQRQQQFIQQLPQEQEFIQQLPQQQFIQQLPQQQFQQQQYVQQQPRQQKQAYNIDNNDVSNVLHATGMSMSDRFSAFQQQQQEEIQPQVFVPQQQQQMVYMESNDYLQQYSGGFQQQGRGGGRGRRGAGRRGGMQNTVERVVFF